MPNFNHMNFPLADSKEAQALWLALQSDCKCGNGDCWRNIRDNTIAVVNALPERMPEDGYSEEDIFAALAAVQTSPQDEIEILNCVHVLFRPLDIARAKAALHRSHKERYGDLLTLLETTAAQGGGVVLVMARGPGNGDDPGRDSGTVH